MVHAPAESRDAARDAGRKRIRRPADQRVNTAFMPIRPSRASYRSVPLAREARHEGQERRACAPVKGLQEQLGRELRLYACAAGEWEF